MTRHHRDAYFERLLTLRLGYGASAEDRRAILAVEDAIRYVEAVMTAVELDAEPWLAELDAAEIDDDAAAPVEAAPGERDWPSPFPRHRSRRSPTSEARPAAPAPDPADDLRN